MLFLEEVLSVCTNSSVLKVIMFLRSLFNVVFTLVPIGLIVMVSVDFAKNVVTSSDDEMKKNVSTALKRIFIAGALFFIPFLVNFAINVLGNNNVEFASCFTNANKEQIAIFEDQEDKRREEEQSNRVDNPVSDIVTEDPYSPGGSSGGYGDNEFHFLNVETNDQASDCIIVGSGGKYGMIDTSHSGFSTYVLNYLKKLEITELEFVIISHAHFDHAENYGIISKTVKINKLYIKSNSLGLHSRYSTIINTAKNAGTTILNPEEDANSTFTLGSINFKFYNREVLKYRAKDSHKADNGNSLVVLATVNGKKVYFAGDIGNYTMYPGVNVNTELKAAKEIGVVDVYKVAHHGYRSYNNADEVLKTLNPTYAIITNTLNGGGRSTVNAMKRVCSNLKEYYLTGDGDVVMTVQSNGNIVFE